MLEEGEVVRVLTASIMELLPEGGSLNIPRPTVGGRPEDERFCVQVDARNDEYYTVRVVPLTEKQRRMITGRTEGALLAQIPEGWEYKINHFRLTSHGLVMPKHRVLQHGFELAARGGFTEVMLSSPDGNEAYAAQAKCSPEDNFCRAEGRTIALDRALRKMERAQAQAAVDEADKRAAAAAGAQS